MPKYSLYEIIKDRLSPNTQRKIESQMRYNELTKQRNKDNENEL